MEESASVTETPGAAAGSRRGALLRRARDLLLPVRERLPAAEHALDLLQRDLLPRSAGGDEYLVCGIVGPNNSGKSALFNSLVGHEISPSLPAGGATRRLLGAAAPQLLARLQADPALARFRLRPLDGPAGKVEAALQPAKDPAELLAVADDGVPANVVLIDTPDFDSILHDNRLASESLLAVADVVIAVVTKHSYQNHDVVRFLRDWLAHGRAWMLVYNEAVDDGVAGAHTAKLVADVGQPPLAVFWAPHSLAVQKGEERLHVRPLLAAGEDETGAAPAVGLRELLFDVERVSDVKTRAFAASLARLCDHLEATALALADEAGAAGDVLGAVRERARQAGTDIAFAAMPAGPFVQAFRAVLDRRTNPLSRGWRLLVRGLRLRVEDLAGVLRGRRQQALPVSPAASLQRVEGEALEKTWPAFWEETVRDLGAEQRHPARARCPQEVRASLDADLGEDRRQQARADAAHLLGERNANLEVFRQACEDLIDQAIEERGFDVDIQAAADIATLAPLALAAAVIVTTSGVVGVDLAVAGGGAVGTFLMEKYSHLLGSTILAQARRRWAQLRGAEIGAILLDATLRRSAPELRSVVERQTSRTRELQRLRLELS
jgi:hypothetical protein